MKHPLSLACLLTSCIAATGCQTEKPAAPPPKPPLVKYSLPVKAVVSDYEDFTGRTEAVFSVEVRARVTGYLEKVNFTDGTEVKEGDLLFEIDPRPYKADLDRAEASVLQSEAHLRRLEADQRRAMNLYERGAISREEVDRIAGDHAEAQAAVGVAKSDRDLSRLNLEFTKVRSPIAGRLSRRLVDPGNLVQADVTPLTTVVSLDPLFVYFDIDERTLLRLRRLVREGKIKSRSEAVIPIQAELVDEVDYPHKGMIDFSDNKVDPSTGTLRVRGRIDNPEPRVLSPGLFMRVRLPIGQPHESILIPEEALGSDQGRKFVYVIEKAKNKKDRLVDMPFRREVKVGAFNKGLRVIEDGVKPGDRVVVSGLQRIREDIEVKPEEVKVSQGAPDEAPALAGE